MDSNLNFLEANFKSINDNTKKQIYKIAISGLTQNYIVGLVDMVDSSRIVNNLPMIKIMKYYEVFLNSMSEVLNKFDGYVIKNAGDSLIYCFPRKVKSNEKNNFRTCLECSLEMVNKHETITAEIQKEELPCLNYRVSIDYGEMILMKSTRDSGIDLIGPPINRCAKINHGAKENSVVIGNEMYRMVKNFDDFYFKKVNGYSPNLGCEYPVYSVQRKN
ncbi:MAG: adenylate/guanylate cyclase domain-containing protein [Nitrosopumilus sp.]|nr:adenylate/guanylate cyclase domain-containing protein [Nitrosopumilus sp.]MDF2423436.1 adenylate/guanylate cyclase domain-containing protein [Nitrosopumilus sp.]MDF2424030.1 adenylate/guanylate cyclase domain-containing protein [Nitrosopumilus sp.]MDF2427373.1 adenylate/guanylate cyclase domain-containing protein [Nitrosopumilus sp.]MDF2428568.1 adenylate/guanylate cyclase domain-containing protein [Nitrosopumilus sp.]